MKKDLLCLIHIKMKIDTHRLLKRHRFLSKMRSVQYKKQNEGFLDILL